MKYVGSKNRLSKELAPIIQSYITEETRGYLEPFVGGANMIDKINCNNKFGSDIHEELIELLKYIQNLDNVLPEHITEEEYKNVRDNKNKYPKWYVGLVGFCATYGARYFEGYARGYKSDGVTPRDIPNEGIRNLEKQRKKLEDIKFKCADYREIKDISNYVIYCDIPYRIEKYNQKKYYGTSFDYEYFYNWCREKGKKNIVLISEYNMPEDFKCIWEKEHKCLMYSGKESNDAKSKRVEKLFIVKRDD